MGETPFFFETLIFYFTYFHFVYFLVTIINHLHIFNVYLFMSVYQIQCCLLDNFFNYALYPQAHCKFFKDQCHLRSFNVYASQCQPLGWLPVGQVLNKGWNLRYWIPHQTNKEHVVPFIATRWQVSIRSPCLWRFTHYPYSPSNFSRVLYLTVLL